MSEPTPPMLQPVSEAIDALEVLHRNATGLVCFSDKVENPRPYFCKVSEIRTWFPKWREQFINEFYTVPNTFWKRRRITQCLDTLNALWVDLDCWDVGVSAGDTLGAIINMVDAGEIPEPTITARSGAGVWAFWSICDTDGGPCKATPANRAKANRTLRHLCRMFKNFGADRISAQCVHYCRAPSTLNTKRETPAPVVWQVHVLDFGEATGFPLYPLDDFMSRVGVGFLSDAIPAPGQTIEAPKHETRKRLSARTERRETPKARTPRERTERPTLESLDVKPHTLKTSRARNKERAILNDMLDLLAMRGIIEEGQRNAWAWTWYATLRRLGQSDTDAKQSTLRLSSAYFAQPWKHNARDAYPDEKILALQEPPTVTSADRRALWTHDEIAFRLGVSDDEARELKTIMPAHIRAERDAAEKAAIERRRQERKRRRQAIEKILRRNPQAGDQKTADAVTRDLGITCSRALVKAIRHALGIEANARGRPITGRGRRRRQT